MSRLSRFSQLFIPTLKEAPADAQVVSHKLLVRAGFIRQLGAGIYDYLPLAKRTLTRIEQIIREEMSALGAQEFYLPALHPAEIWKESGRWDVMGDNMFRLRDRKHAEYCLGMTHEEIFTAIARDRKSTRLNSSHSSISYAVFCLKKKKQTQQSSYFPSLTIHNLQHHPFH